jgi:hypothetical protein
VARLTRSIRIDAAGEAVTEDQSMYMTQAVHKGLREQPHTTAAICGADRVTRAELAGRVARFARADRRVN